MILKLLAEYGVPVINILGSSFLVALAVRFRAVIMLVIDRTRLVRDLDHANERIADKDEQIEDLKQSRGTARLSNDSLRDQIVELNGKVEVLQQRVDDLSHKLDITVDKYDAAIKQIADPSRPIPLSILDDVDHARRHMNAS